MTGAAAAGRLVGRERELDEIGRTALPDVIVAEYLVVTATAR